MTNCVSLLHSDYQDEERGDEGKEMLPEEQTERDIPTDSLFCTNLKYSYPNPESLFVRTSVGTISGQYISMLCSTTPHPREIKG